MPSTTSTMIPMTIITLDMGMTHLTESAAEDIIMKNQADIQEVEVENEKLTRR